MLSVIVQFRNRAPITVPCLQSILETFKSLGQPQSVEFILVDDASDAGLEVAPLLLEARRNTTSDVRVVRFKQRQHYTRACAHSFSMARGDVLFVSHDMILTTDCVQNMLQVSALDPSHGIVRATSNYVDCFPQHIITPPLPVRDIRHVRSFSRFVSEYHGLTFVEDHLLTGDVMFIKRDVLNKIGTMDTRYYGYFGDIDFGLRAQHAGYKLVCAKGAWLFHEGAGFYKNEQQTKHLDPGLVQANRMKTVNDAYHLFRQKWDPTLPPNYPGADAMPFGRLRSLSPLPFPLLQPPPPPLTPEVGEVL